MTNWFIRSLLNLVSPQPCLAAIIRRNGKILLTRRAPSLIEGGKWCLPGGHLDKGETAEAGVLREVREEIGIAGKRARFLFYHDEFVPRLHLHALILVFDVSFSGTVKPNWEVSEWKWFSLSDVLAMDIAFTHKAIIKKVMRGKR
ncbi:MAG: NUDIX hydrolase [Nanoarchaeota archaeon]